jgi:excisionase family DNA binding protein
MKENLYTVDQVAELIGMHPKTIRRFIREGKLKANKVGKQYRINGHDLSLFTEGDVQREMTVDHEETQRGTSISMVVDVKSVSEDNSTRIANMLLAVMNHKDSSYGKATMQTKYYPSEGKLQILIWGSLKFTKMMLENIEMLMED